MSVDSVPMPKISANDEVATIVEWSKSAGEFVHKGEVICSAETSKSIFDIEASSEGYLTQLAESGSQVQVGDPVAVIATEPVGQSEALSLLAALAHSAPETPEAQTEAKVEITLKARLLAQKFGIDLAELSTNGKRVTEDDVMQWADIHKQVKPVQDGRHDLMDSADAAHRTQQILIIGGGDGAVQVLDVLAKTPDQRAVAIVDDNDAIHDKTIGGVPVIGGINIDRMVEMYERREFDAAVISISTLIKLRAEIFEKLKTRGVKFANIIHPTAVVGVNVSLGEGNVIMAFCHIGACAVVGDNNFLSAYCSIEHHNHMGNHCSFGPGVVTSSRVTFGDRVRCGTGIYIEPKIRIGADAVIGSGCIIWRNVPERSVLKSKLNYVERKRE